MSAIGPWGVLTWDKVPPPLCCHSNGCWCSYCWQGEQQGNRRVRATNTVSSENELSPQIFQHCTAAVLPPWTCTTQPWLSSAVSFCSHTHINTPVYSPTFIGSISLCISLPLAWGWGGGGSRGGVCGGYVRIHFIMERPQYELSIWTNVL